MPTPHEPPRNVGTSEAPRPEVIVKHLLAQPSGAVMPPDSPSLRRSIANLEADAPELIAIARDAGVQIEYLGVHPLFAEPRLYPGVKTDWVLAPASRPEDTIVPRQELRRLRRLAETELEFLIYIAHETPKPAARRVRGEPSAGTGPVVLTPQEAEELIGPVPPPIETAVLGDRLAARSRTLLRGVRHAAIGLGAAAVGVAALPVVALGGALASLAMLDPVVLGAVPALGEEPGEPAAWFALARWDW